MSIKIARRDAGRFVNDSNIATSGDVPRRATEAETLEALSAKLERMVSEVKSAT
ncbi:MAG: DUF1902 domain-containing protein [Candidatus Accumulibacter sp.]|nr:DUF1902 domain-containing protein [Accumulibacter sp.]